MERVILHSDLNNFYASVECRENPALRNRVVIICGDAKQRRGVVVAKNQLAKKLGIKTGDTLWQAEQKCRDLVAIKPDLLKYREYSKRVREIYYRYTDKVEPFGLDEAWLDVTGSQRLFGTGEEIANKIREDIKREMGLTVSVGVSFNKVFAKLGSDMKKPDAVTCITRENFKEKVWPLPVGEILYAGRATQEKLISFGIDTIGKLAKAEPEFLERLLGKGGLMLSNYARGEDDSPVANYGEREPVKSIGNSITLPRDVTDSEEIRQVLYLLAESVCERLRAQRLLCKTVSVGVRDSALVWHERQCGIAEGEKLSGAIAEYAYSLFCEMGYKGKPVHSIGLRVSNLYEDNGEMQMNLFDDISDKLKKREIENVVDGIREKYGHKSIGRAMLIGGGDFYRIKPGDEQIVSFPGTEDG